MTDAPPSLDSLAPSSPVQPVSSPLPPTNAWASFDVSKLRDSPPKLQYYEPELRDGERIARLSASDVKAQVHYWQNAVVCYVLGMNPPFHVMNGYLRRIWKIYTIDKIIQLQHGVFLARFDSNETKEAVLQRGTPYFDEIPVVVLPWKENMELREDVHKIPVWIQFPQLPLKYWGEENLCRLASQLGIPLQIDMLTRQRDRGQFARMQVQMAITEKLQESVMYEDEHGRLRVQRVHYEWNPVRCTHCKGYGHCVEQCRKAKPQAEVPKPPDLPATEDTQAWTVVTRKRNKGKAVQKDQGQPPVVKGPPTSTVQGCTATSSVSKGMPPTPSVATQGRQQDAQPASGMESVFATAGPRMVVCSRDEEELVEKGPPPLSHS